ncbi:MAG: hypothetical protein HQK50_06385 [Oligoflexia bacterium]|nr:hypothetical protein [Oligoflexia bacterium]
MMFTPFVFATLPLLEVLLLALGSLFLLSALLFDLGLSRHSRFKQILIKRRIITLYSIGNRLNLLSLACLLVTILICFFALPVGVNVGIAFDHFSLFFIFIVVVISLVSHPSVRMPLDLGRATLLNAFFSALLTLLLLLVLAANSVLLALILWEMATFCGLLLLAIHYQKKSLRKALLAYAIVAEMGTLFLVVALGMIYIYSNTDPLTPISFSRLATLPATIKEVVLLLLFFGFAAKSDLFPFHLWAVRSYPAIMPRTATLFSSATAKVAFALTLRFYFSMEITQSSYVGVIIFVLAILSIVLGSLYTISQKNLHRMLAYSTVENMGILYLGFALFIFASSLGHQLLMVFAILATFFFVLHHALSKALALQIAGTLAETLKRPLRIDELGGIAKIFPWMSRLMLIAFLSLMGAPFFSGFIAEALLLMVAFKSMLLGAPYILLAIIAIFALVVANLASIASFTKAYTAIFQGVQKTVYRSSSIKEKLYWRRFTLYGLLLLLGIFAMGIFPWPIILELQKIVIALYPQSRIMLSNLNMEIAVPMMLFSLSLTLFFLLFLLLKVSLWWLLRDKTIRRDAITWDCGMHFTSEARPLQYTGTSYLMSMITFFRPLLFSKSISPRIVEIFPDKKSFYRLQIADFLKQPRLQNLSYLLIRPLKIFHEIPRQGHIQWSIFSLVLALIVTIICFVRS